MSIFFVERYWPGVTTDVFHAAVARLDAVLDAIRAGGRDIRHLGSTLVPAEETVFSVFDADDLGLVAEAHDRAGFAYDRLLSAHAHPEKVATS